MALCMFLAVGAMSFATDPVDKTYDEITISGQDAVASQIAYANNIEASPGCRFILIVSQEITETKSIDMINYDVCRIRWQPGNYSSMINKEIKHNSRDILFAPMLS